MIFRLLSISGYCIIYPRRIRNLRILPLKGNRVYVRGKEKTTKMLVKFCKQLDLDLYIELTSNRMI